MDLNVDLSLDLSVDLNANLNANLNVDLSLDLSVDHNVATVTIVVPFDSESVSQIIQIIQIIQIAHIYPVAEVHTLPATDYPRKSEDITSAQTNRSAHEGTLNRFNRFKRMA